MQQFFLALVFVVVAATGFLLLVGFDQRRQQGRLLRERLEAINHAVARNPSEEIELLRDELLSGIPTLNKMLAKSARASVLQGWLSQAGLKVRAGKFLLACIAMTGFLGLVGYLLTRSTWFTPFFMAAGAGIPVGVVVYRRNQRLKQFEELFPEAIDLLARAVRAGHAFTTALELIAQELNEPVASEFRQVFEEQKFGLPIRDALLNLAERVPIVDVKFFVTALMLQRETGGNLAEILDKLSYIIRERFKILRQVRVYTAQGRLTLMILMALPPSCVGLMMVVNPDFIKVLFTDTLGHVLVAAGLTMQTIGYFLIRRIIHIKV